MSESKKVFASLTKKDKARFWKHVSKGCPDECWPWKGRLASGYGQLKCRGRYGAAHVLSFLFGGGELLDGEIVRHVVCRNPSCCNPLHLESGTHKDNAMDRERDGMTARGDRNGSRLYPERLKRGRDNPKLLFAKLTEENIVEIRGLCSIGMPQRKIAAMFNISQQNISSINRGKIWKFIMSP